MGDAVVDLLRIGGVRRVELGGNRELAAAENALEPAAGGVAGECGKRRCRVLADIAWDERRRSSRAPVRSSAASATASQDEWPFRRWSTGGWTSSIRLPSAILRLPSQASTQTQGISA